MKLIQRGTDVVECCGCGALATVYEYDVGDVSSPMKCTCGDDGASMWRWVVWDDPKAKYRYSRHSGYTFSFPAAVNALIASSGTAALRETA